ncbi:Hypothetical protein PHPALM_6269 [Phytophthora palmivora]|uniref:Uncharacterized protein n=1 Tax=Phytophthora palmivora TaxID=4796 RepID=A0A2P4YFB5_9STRA|nr:Hypothetical protein PHPALM_6269 [Phytophthora palmivora]
MKHVRDRLQRWAMRLCGLHYKIEHIPVSRWNTRDTEQIAAVQTRSHPVTPVSSLSRLCPLDDENFMFPAREDINVAQEAASREFSRLNNFSEEENGVVTVANRKTSYLLHHMTIDHRIWIRTGAHDLLARIFVVSHCGSKDTVVKNRCSWF